MEIVLGTYCCLSESGIEDCIVIEFGKDEEEISFSASLNGCGMKEETGIAFGGEAMEVIIVMLEEEEEEEEERMEVALILCLSDNTAEEGLIGVFVFAVRVVSF
jgi:hypothetical protein